MSRIDASLFLHFLIKPLVFINLIVAGWHKIMNWGARWTDIKTSSRKKKIKIDINKVNDLIWCIFFCRKTFHLKYQQLFLLTLKPLISKIYFSPLRYVYMRLNAGCHVTGWGVLALWLRKAEHLIKWNPPGGFVTGTLQPVFPIRTAAEPWTTLCESFMVALHHFGAVNTVLVIAIPHVEQRRKILQ